MFTNGRGPIFAKLHAVVLWNSLPYTVVNAGSLDQFKQRIQGQNI